MHESTPSRRQNACVIRPRRNSVGSVTTGMPKEKASRLLSAAAVRKRIEQHIDQR